MNRLIILKLPRTRGSYDRNTGTSSNPAPTIHNNVNIQNFTHKVQKYSISTTNHMYSINNKSNIRLKEVTRLENGQSLTLIANHNS